MTKVLRVEIRDRDPEVEHLRMILGMLGFRFDYEAVDLIARSLEVYKEKEGGTSIDDVFDVRAAWEKHWNNYFRPKIDVEVNEPTGE